MDTLANTNWSNWKGKWNCYCAGTAHTTNLPRPSHYNDPDPYLQPIDLEIEGVIDDEPIEENVEDDHKDMNIDPADQDEEVNEANEAKNENEGPTLADEA